jgi:peptide/nickel transport system substrate-binding protein
VPQPVVVSNRLNNLPEEALYNWEPGAHFGIYRLDGLWFSDAPAQSAAKP